MATKSVRPTARRSLFWSLVLRAITRRRLHLAIILLSIAIGVSVVSAMTNLYQNLSDQLSQQFRQYGANVVIQAKNGNLKSQQVNAVAKHFGASVVAYSSFYYQTGKVDQKVVTFVGVNLKQLPALYPYWKLKGSWPQNSKEAIIGQKVATKLALKPGKIVSFSLINKESKSLVLKRKISGVFESGSDDEAQIFTALPSAKAQVAYFSIIGQGQQLQQQLKLAKVKFSGLKIETIRRLAATEAKVLGQIKYLVWLVAFIILITSILGVATTLASLVVERRGEIALKKALGAENEQITSEFVSESLLLGVAGGLLGWLIGIILAQWISRVVFNAVIAVSVLSFILSFSVALMVSIIAVTMPVRMALQIQPATVLKGE